MTQKRILSVAALSRVEGEGAMEVHLNGSEVDRVQLRIYEPPRFFEALLKGRDVREVPDIVARICGICPVAYQMSACRALEKALEMEIPTAVSRLRRLLYCGEWLESHALHIVMLHAPDFLGYENSFELAADYPEIFHDGLRIRKVGNDLLTVLGGRAIHPVNVTVGGFYRTPSLFQLQQLLPELEWAQTRMEELLRVMASWEFGTLECNYQFVALQDQQEYPLNEGRVVASDGLDIPIEEFELHFREVQVPHSTALHCVRLPEHTPYLVGPLARFNLCRQQLTPRAKAISESLLGSGPVFNNSFSILIRGIEVLFALETAAQQIREYDPSRTSTRVEIPLRSGVGCHATEAPRGTLYHRYEVDARGKIAAALIVPPTSQNQGQIEADLRALVPDLLSLNDQQATRACENLIRNYDPCISCATHFLKIEWHGRSPQRVTKIRTPQEP
ncbi:MAG TPA: Ni/Fe hydrogenase subunit alpha [Pirellulaceae bacterium]|nr:Ni/Fe hydrogenase subunit alpha [Pirellulaceae bacterium]HMO91133.1 Ni/Fe hydrogenase subunit alpha [Pirellulaceae bacterium]HMP71072.1 Ni/Fe hydrogenase subunit alpha [Pirellulaceae bacterium]